MKQTGLSFLCELIAYTYSITYTIDHGKVLVNQTLQLPQDCWASLLLLLFTSHFCISKGHNWSFMAVSTARYSVM